MKNDIKIEKIEHIILIESIKKNIACNPNKDVWFGVVMVNGKEYHWHINEREINADYEKF
jgi:hypothetical protein